VYDQHNSVVFGPAGRDAIVQQQAIAVGQVDGSSGGGVRKPGAWPKCAKEGLQVRIAQQR
jgi:hypothetical protein